MAIDGVKIIDSDDGYDIYHSIIERYKDGEKVDKIIADVLSHKDNFCTDELYTEIYWTALAYSLWKIGHLPDDIRDQALKIIQKGANEFWLEIDCKALSKRQKELHKLAIQLQRKNLKPIKVPKARVKRKPYFKKGDVLAVKFKNEYGLIFVSAIDQTPRKIEYHLACTRWLHKEKPNMDDFLNSKIDCSQQDIKYWLNTDCWFNHKDFGMLLNHFEKIGQVELEDYFLGVLSPAHTLDDIYNEITENIETCPGLLTEYCPHTLNNTYYLIKNLNMEEDEGYGW